MTVRLDGGPAAFSEAEVSEQEQRATRQNAELWAGALLSHVGAHFYTLGNTDLSGNWRARAGVLTESPAAAEAGQTPAAATEATGELITSKLIVRVETARFGEVAVTVDRSRGGLDVTVDVESNQALSELEPERRALHQALEAAGLPVQTVRVVFRRGYGTVLAHSLSAQSGAARKSTRKSDDEEGPSEPPTNRLNLVG